MMNQAKSWPSPSRRSSRGVATGDAVAVLDGENFRDPKIRWMRTIGVAPLAWVGFVGKILTGNPWVFTIKYRAFL